MPSSFREVEVHVSVYIRTYKAKICFRPDIMMTLSTPDENKIEVVINRDQFEVGTPSSFRISKQKEKNSLLFNIDAVCAFIVL